MTVYQERSRSEGAVNKPTSEHRPSDRCLRGTLRSLNSLVQLCSFLNIIHTVLMGNDSSGEKLACSASDLLTPSPQQREAWEDKDVSARGGGIFQINKEPGNKGEAPRSCV